MQLTLTTRRIELTDALKGHAEERLGRLEKFMDRGVGAHFVLSVEKYRHTAELTIHADGVTHHSKEVTGDMYLSIDRVVEKIERQLRRYRERRRSLKRCEKVPSENMPSEAEDVETSGRQVPIVRAERCPLRVMSPSEAVLQLQLSGKNFFIFRNDSSGELNVIYRIDEGSLGLVEAESRIPAGGSGRENAL